MSSQRRVIVGLRIPYGPGSAFGCPVNFRESASLSFAVMERLGLTQVASFDDDFAIYRYGRNRDRAFEVLR